MEICQNLSNATLLIAYVFLFLFCLVFQKGENVLTSGNAPILQKLEFFRKS